MLLPIVKVPEGIARSMEPYREAFVRAAGFEHVSRYITGLLTNPNKTLQAIHACQVFPDGSKTSRRAMHEAVLDGAWTPENLFSLHAANADQKTCSKGKRVIWIDWTFGHHARGLKIWGNAARYDYVNRQHTRYQVLVTLGVSTPQRIDGLNVQVQAPRVKEEEEYLKHTAKPQYDSMEAAHTRLLELLCYEQHRKQYQKRTDMAASMIRQLESEGRFQEADYAFDNGLLCKQVVDAIEEAGKDWVSELEATRLVFWNNQWKPISAFAEHLRQESPDSFRPYTYEKRNGEQETVYAFTKVMRLKKYERKRIVIMHREPDLSDKPTYYVTSGISWQVPRVMRTWSFRWGAEIFHEFAKQAAGLEDGQCRNEGAVKRHSALCCLAQSILWDQQPAGAASERFGSSDERNSLGQRSYGLIRQVWAGILEYARNLWLVGRTNEEILEQLLPA